MKVIKYKLCTIVNYGTEEFPQLVELLDDKLIYCAADNLEANEAIAKKEAYNGEYTIEDEPVPYPVAPHNITSGEYVIINGVLYLATENIPNGESVIVGQNAIVTTVEQQLYELKGE